MSEKTERLPSPKIILTDEQRNVVEAFEQFLTGDNKVFILLGARTFSLVFQGVGGKEWIEGLLINLPGGAKLAITAPGHIPLAAALIRKLEQVRQC